MNRNYIKQDLIEGEYHSVGGDATHIIFNFPGYGALYMGNMISLSYQSYRDKTPVYNLGSTNIDGFAIGKRYVAGSIIKTVFLHDDMTAFLQNIAKELGIKHDVDSITQLKLEKTRGYHHLMMDDILPFDIIIMLSSEYGAFSVSEVIYGATLINSGQVHSINDLITESTMSFVARDARQTRDKIGSIVYGEALNKDRKASTLTSKTSYKYENDTEHLKDQDFYKAKLKEYTDKYNNDENGEELSPLERTQLATLSQLAGLGITPDYDYSSLNSDMKPNKNNYGQTTFNDIDLSTLVYQVTGSKNKANIDDGDTVTFYDVKTTRGAPYQNMVGNNTNDLNKRYAPGQLEIRISPIDTPEVRHDGQWDVDQDYGQEAKVFLEEYMKSGQWDRDVKDGYVKLMSSKTYGRLVVYNYRYALQAIESGYAHYIPEFARENGATPQEMRMMEQAQIDARKGKRGLWSSENTIESPSDFRKRMSKEQKSLF